MLTELENALLSPSIFLDLDRVVGFVDCCFVASTLSGRNSYIISRKAPRRRSAEAGCHSSNAAHWSAVEYTYKYDDFDTISPHCCGDDSSSRTEQIVHVVVIDEDNGRGCFVMGRATLSCF